MLWKADTSKLPDPVDSFKYFPRLLVSRWSHPVTLLNVTSWETGSHALISCPTLTSDMATNPYPLTNTGTDAGKHAVVSTTVPFCSHFVQKPLADSVHTELDLISKDVELAARTKAKINNKVFIGG